MWKLLAIIAIAINPAFVSAAGLVPCGGAGEPVCGTCEAVKLISNVSEFVVTVMGLIAIIMIMFSGLKMVVSVGNVSSKQALKNSISNVIIGFVLVLAGWLIIDTLMKAFLSDQTYGVWNDVKCTSQTIPVKK